MIFLPPNAVRRFLQLPGLTALHAATKQRGVSITLNSAYRSAAQQYLLYSWYLAGQCNIQIAAVPGTSNHEGGAAFDTSDYTAWQTTLAAHDWQWYGAGDRVHFTYVGAGIRDLRAANLKVRCCYSLLGLSLLLSSSLQFVFLQQAFQQLWNAKNPNAKIAEDGVYGPATANAFHNSPCTGFA